MIQFMRFTHRLYAFLAILTAMMFISLPCTKGCEMTIESEKNIPPTITGYSAQKFGINQEQIDSLFENSSDFVAIFGGDRFKKVNKKFQEDTGWSEEELTQRPFKFFSHPDDIQKELEMKTFPHNSLSSFCFERRTRRKNNSYLWVQWLALSKLTPLLENFENQTFFVIGHDVTTQKEQEEAKVLKDEQRELKRSLESQKKLIHAIFEIQYSYIKRKPLEEKIDFENDSPVIKNCYPLELILQHIIELSESEFGFVGELFYNTLHEPFLQQIFSGGFQNTALNVRMPKALIKEGTLSKFNNILGDAIETKKPLIINDVKNYPKPTGIPSDHLPINTFLCLPLISYYNDNELVGIFALANRKQGYNEEILNWLKPLHLLAERIVNELKWENWRKKAEEQERARKQAEAENIAKSKFLAHMSHEIRTPLAGLLGVLDLINKEYLHEEDLKYLQIAHGSGWSLLSILNDILDISKIEAGQLKIEAIKFKPVGLVNEVVDILLPEAKKKGLDLKLITSTKIHPYLIGDPTRLRQIIFNLVGNALKFTSMGSVTVSLDGTYDSGHFMLVGSVSDTGIGISHEVHERLFKPFSQADSSMARRFGGTGLGLFITKQLCEMMGGSISVSSEVGKGSTFTFKVFCDQFQNLIPPMENNSPIQIPDKLQNIRVLVAEDNAVSQLVLTRMLENAGHYVDKVWNGQEAVKAVTLNHYDLILMDGEMPIMDGCTATQKIRDYFNAEVLPIIGVTAHAMMEDHEKFLKAGMNGYLTKPVNKESLFAEIFRCLAIKQDTHF